VKRLEVPAAESGLPQTPDATAAGYTDAETPSDTGARRSSQIPSL